MTSLEMAEEFGLCAKCEEPLTGSGDLCEPCYSAEHPEYAAMIARVEGEWMDEYNAQQADMIPNKGESK